MATKDVREPASSYYAGSLDNLHNLYQYARVVLLNRNYILFILFAFDALQFIFVVNVLQSVFFIKLNGEGQAPSPYPTPLKSFYLKKKMIMCAS